ncbi:hypothetical protein MAA_09203 [Metarhizium robertsii ARSEF 23]|uniref:Uncharacterized protein n=1 Tax=Metarhizium robertsii (strain ARSEF 23 / ATCC MYA-3075) TaxID=655844 RepID=E9FAA4_METRA|nr:uncharacterized protein MAA_09203 [Metarhizium robertsii ARSEF 23]EFY95389.1 hypothetical protein MAA_09203 [Metarhizium robertsii ARSEF 23]
MKLTALLVIASAISVHCQASTSTSRSSTITAPPTARPTTSVGTISRPTTTTRRTNTTVVAAGPNPVAPGIGLAALMALGALV